MVLSRRLDVVLILVVAFLTLSRSQNTTAPITTTTAPDTTPSPSTTVVTTTDPASTTPDQNAATKAYVVTSMQYLPSTGSQQTLALYIANFMNTTTSWVGLERVTFDEKTKTLRGYLWVGEYIRNGNAALLAKADALATGINTLAFQNPLIMPGSASVVPLPSISNVVPSSGMPMSTLLIIIAMLVVGILFMIVLTGAVIYCLFFRRRAPSGAGTIRRMDVSHVRRSRLAEREMDELPSSSKPEDVPYAYVTQ